MVIVPVRGCCPLGATEKETAPSCVPEGPPVMVIHGTLLTAFHAQLPTTETTPVPPVIAKDCADGTIPYSSHVVAPRPMPATGRKNELAYPTVAPAVTPVAVDTPQMLTEEPFTKVKSTSLIDPPTYP